MKTEGNRDVILPEDAENTIDRARKRQRTLKKKQKTESTWHMEVITSSVLGINNGN